MADIDFFYPFDSVSGDRKTTAATERRFFNALFTNGVVGADAFPVTESSAGVWSVGAGVAIVGGAIGGVVSAKSVTAKPAQGAKLYIALRLDTTSAVRKITLEATATLKTATAAQLDSGAQLDLPLYSVEGQAGGGYGLLDERAYCTSFDNSIFESEFAAVIDRISDSGEAEISALVQQFEATIAEADAETAGLYGAAGRQGFINPTFSVNQRGKDAYELSSGMTYTFDRWLARIGGAATASPVSVGREQDGARLALKVANKAYASGSTSAASAIAQNVEGGLRTFCAGGRQFTVSFDAKASAAQKLAVEPVQFAQAGGAGTAITAQTVSLTTSWQRFSLTFAGTVTPTAAQLEDVLKVAFFFAWRGQSERFGADQNAANTVWLANMQINEGSAALPCYVKPYADELEACKRYFVALGFTSLAVSAQNASTRQVHTSPLPLTRTMRKQPAVSFADRTGVPGVSSAEVAAGTWRNGLVCAMSSSAKDNPVFTVTNTDAAEITRVVFSSVTLDSELVD